MDGEKVNFEAYDLGVSFGIKAAKSSFHYYTEKMQGAEVEEDVLEIMSIYWRHDELLLSSMFSPQDMSVVRDGWTDGFLNTVFPLRHWC